MPRVDWIEPSNIVAGLRSQRDALRRLVRTRTNAPLELRLSIDKLSQVIDDVEEYADDCRQSQQSAKVLIPANRGTGDVLDGKILE